jgi:uncharacterized protein
MFERDEDKNRRNLAKHGIAFKDVLAVFPGRKTLSLEDRRRDYGELGCVVLCPLGDVLVHVTYAVRGGSIRLMSARRASRREKRDDALRKPHSGVLTQDGRVLIEQPDGSYRPAPLRLGAGPGDERGGGRGGCRVRS